MQWIRVAFAASAARQRSDGRIESKRSCSEIFMISEARSSLPAKGEPLLQCRHTDREQTIYWCNLRKNINFNWFSCSEEKSLTIGRSIFDPIVHEDGGVIAFHFHFHD